MKAVWYQHNVLGMRVFVAVVKVCVCVSVCVYKMVYVYECECSYFQVFANEHVRGSFCCTLPPSNLSFVQLDEIYGHICTLFRYRYSFSYMLHMCRLPG